MKPEIRVASFIRQLVAKAQRRSLAQYKFATVNAAKYLQQLNMQQLTKTQKPGLGQDKKQFFEALQKEALEGPLFPSKVLTAIEDITVDMTKEEVKWLAGELLSSHPNLNNLQHILDWSRATQTKLLKQRFEDAFKAAEEWHDQFHGTSQDATGKYKTKDVVFKYPDGFTMVKVTDPDDLRLEGELMQHCVGGYCEIVRSGRSSIFSLRDPQNKPHVTIEVASKGDVVQIQGKQNDRPAPKYQGYVLQWLMTLSRVSWLNLISNWEIYQDPAYQKQLKSIKMKDPKHIFSELQSQGPDDDYEDALIATKSATYILRYVEHYLGVVDMEKFTEAMISTGDISHIIDFAKLKGADIRLISQYLLDYSTLATMSLNNFEETASFIEETAGIINDKKFGTESAEKLKAWVETNGDIRNIHMFLRYFPEYTKELYPRFIEEALTEDPDKASEWAYRFAERAQNRFPDEKVLSPKEIKQLEAIIIASGDPKWAYYFAKNIEGADIKKLQDVVIKEADPEYIYLFAKDVDSADIQKLSEAMREGALFGRSKTALFYNFVRDIQGADLKALAEASVELTNNLRKGTGSLVALATLITTKEKPEEALKVIEKYMLNPETRSVDYTTDLVDFSLLPGVDVKAIQKKLLETDDSDALADFRDHTPGADKELIDKRIKEILGK